MMVTFFINFNQLKNMLNENMGNYLYKKYIFKLSYIGLSPEFLFH